MVDEKKQSYKNVILAVHIIVFVTIIVLVYFTMLINEKRDVIISSGKASAEDTADQFNSYMSTSINALKLTADGIDHMLAEQRTNEDISDYVVSQSTAVKNAVSENFTGIYGCIRGEFVSGTGWVPDPGYDAKSRPWYTKAIEGGGEVTLLEPYTDVQTGKTMLAAVKRLGDGDSVIGVDISLEELQKITEKAVSDGTSDMEIILDDDGCVIAHSDIREMGKNYFSDSSDSLGYKIVNSADYSDKDYYEIDDKGTRYIIYQALVGRNWRAISVRNATNVFGPLIMILVWTIAVVVVMVIVLAIVFRKLNKKSIEASRAIAASEARSAFLSNMSHEIRTPINAMIGMNEMILRETKDEDIREYSTRVKAAGDSLLLLVNEMLDFSENTGLGEREQKKFMAPGADILVIDDNPVNLLVFRNLLKKTKIEIDTAESGAEGLKLAGEKRYDILFFDHMMPEMDGIEALHRLKKETGGPNINTPVVCVTANVIPGAKEHYLSEGFDDYITKPVDPAGLEDMILKYLPADKVTFVEEGSEEGAAGEASIPMFIKEIPDINVPDGIKNNGSPESFMETLKVYAQMVGKNVSEIKGYMDSGDINNATIKIHALKSTSRIIGAGDLGDLAQELENAGKAGDEETLKRRLPELLDRCCRVGELLSPLIEEDVVTNTQDLPPIGEERFRAVMERIGEYAADYDNAGIEDLMEELKKYNLSEAERNKMSDILQALDVFDFDKIAEIVAYGS